MNYYIQEGSLTLPGTGHLADETVNILRFPQHQSSLVITRTRLAEGQTPQAYLALQLQQLKKEMRHFLADEPKETMLGSVPALEVSSSFEKQGVKIYQSLLCTQQAPALLVLTFSRLLPPDKATVAWWEQVRAGFTWHNA